MRRKWARPKHNVSLKFQSRLSGEMIQPSSPNVDWMVMVSLPLVVGSPSVSAVWLFSTFMSFEFSVSVATMLLQGGKTWRIYGSVVITTTRRVRFYLHFYYLCIGQCDGEITSIWVFFFCKWSRLLLSKRKPVTRIFINLKLYKLLAYYIIKSVHFHASNSSQTKAKSVEAAINNGHWRIKQ